MELAIRVLCVDEIVALGRFVIALNPFRAYWDRSQGNFICLKDFSGAQHRHLVGGLQDNDLVCLSGGCFNAAKRRNQEDHQMNAALVHIWYSFLR
jgi:hypothetical protein